MRVCREGKLKNSDLRTGDTLSLELYGDDVALLADPERRYIVARFGEFPHRGLGWAMEDKVWVRLSQPVQPQDEEQLASLSLDLGGDLYFDIWENKRLVEARACEVFDDLGKFLRSDPSGKIEHLGIVAVRLYGLNFVAEELYKPFRPFG